MAANERKSRPGRLQSEATSAGFALHPKASTEAKIAAIRTKSMNCSASILRFPHISARFFQGAVDAVPSGINANLQRREKIARQSLDIWPSRHLGWSERNRAASYQG
jgi:hypothetical protein